MSPGPSILTGGRRRSQRRRGLRYRSRRRPPPLRPGPAAVVVLATVVLVVAVLLVALAGSVAGPGEKTRASVQHPPPPAPKPTVRPFVPAGYGVAPAPRPERVQIRLSAPLRSGLLFDVRTGEVLWSREPDRILPIASLTKMMTALVVATRDRPQARVLITRQAVDFSGSGVGLLPLRKRVRLLPLLYGLMLPSGNDAAIALAQHTARTQGRFIALMNARARAMGLTCTHYTTVSGFVDAGNHSCAADLAKIARAVLDLRLLARIVASASAVLPFPIKGHKLFLYNNNPLYALHYPGTDGVKTGYTVAAGVCLVATARHGRTWLGVVLLHSADEAAQAPALLNAGFAAEARARKPSPRRSRRRGR